MFVYIHTYICMYIASTDGWIIAREFLAVETKYILVKPLATTGAGKEAMHVVMGTLDLFHIRNL